MLSGQQPDKLVHDYSLVKSSDKKSVVFTGHLIGSANIHISADNWVSVDSGLITVVANAGFMNWARKLGAPL